MENIIFAVITSFLIVAIFTPSLIQIAIMKRLVDSPSSPRKLHSSQIPSIGGIAIFLASLFSYLLWYPFSSYDIDLLLDALKEFKFIGAAMLTMFFLGLKDDIVGTSPVKKLIVHIVVAFILVIMADIRITSMYGIFGIEELPEWMSILFSVLVYTVVVNAFNLIDGVDGLAAGVGLIASSSFGLWFMLAGDSADSLLAFSLSGALLGFLIYNFDPARIFMGDSGSLTIGLIISILCIKMIEFDIAKVESPFLVTISKPIFAMACIVYPLIDTARIFVFRIVKGLPPLGADNNHLHHLLIRLGLKHWVVALIIYAYTLVVISVAIFWQLEPSLRLAVVFVVSVVGTVIPVMLCKRRKAVMKS